MDMYGMTVKLTKLYSCLQDDISKEIFWARQRTDVEWSLPSETAMVGIRRLAELRKHSANLILYGTRVTGRNMAVELLGSGIDFYGFCGRRYSDFPNGLMGKPVVSPEWLVENARDMFVIVAASSTYGSRDEILSYLREHRFPEGHIVSEYDVLTRKCLTAQYFEFPNLYRRGTAFVDAGCFDGETSMEFARWCENNYSKIYAFEPDPVNCERARRRLQESGLHDVELLESGLSCETAEADFYAIADQGARILPTSESTEELRRYITGRVVEDERRQNVRKVRTVSLDKAVGDETVGFIKMDIKGAELDALHGAEKTIVRDRPLLAISVYHKAGDMLAIMDYCKRLVPEYRFWLRQYHVLYDTVLYASI